MSSFRKSGHIYVRYNPIVQKDYRFWLVLVLVRSESDLLVESYDCANIDYVQLRC